MYISNLSSTINGFSKEILESAASQINSASESYSKSFSNTYTLGNINNKKGISSTYDSTNGAIVYALATIDSSTGRQLIIKTFKGTTGKLDETQTLIPQIPYRFSINDKDFFHGKLTQSLKSHSVAFQLFNPGISYDGDTFDIGTENWGHGLSKMIQINLNRDAVSAMACPDEYEIYYDRISRNFAKLRNTKITVSDSQASMRVKQDEDTNIDYLYITVCTRVDIDAEYGFFRSYYSYNYIPQHWNYSVPVTMKFEINKSSHINSAFPVSLLPVSWSYPINNSWKNTDAPVDIGKITNYIRTMSFTENLWNYNLIPGRIKSGQIFHPISYGCLADMTMDDNSGVYVFSEVGNYITNKDVNGALPYRQICTLSHIDLTPTGFILPTTNDRALTINSENQFCSNVTIEQASGTYIVASVDSYYNEVNRLHLLIYNTTDLTNRSTIVVNDASHSDLTFNNSDLYLKYNDLSNKNLCIYKFPVINEALISSLGFGIHSQSSINGIFSRSDLTLVSQTSDLPVKRILFGYILDDFKNKNYFIDTLSSDKTILKQKTIRDFSFAYLKFNQGNYAIEHIDLQTTQIPTVYYKHSNLDSTSLFSKINLDTMLVDEYQGYGSNEYCILNLKSDISTKVVSVNYINRYANADLTLGNTISIQYWYNPMLSTDYSVYAETELDDNQNGGVGVLINIQDCSGIYSSGVFSVDSFDLSLVPNIDNGQPGGVEISPYTRSDINFKYSGNKSIFTETYGTTSGGYMAVGNSNVVVTCKDSYGSNILYGESSTTLPITVWKYSDSGLFDLQLRLDLDLNDTDIPYDSPNFAMTNNVLDVNVYNNVGLLLDNSSYTFNITIPDGSGIIYSEDNETKTISQLTFFMERNGTLGDSDYTELHNVTKVHRSIWNKSDINSTPIQYKKLDASSDIYYTPITDIQRGDYIYYTYEPKLNGTKPIVTNLIANSELVTNCNGHKYWIDNVEVKFGYGVSYGDNVIDDITELDPYIYVDSVNDSCLVKVTLDINHEDWSDGSIRDNNAASTIYPLISGIYILAIDEEFNRYEDFNLDNLKNWKNTFQAYDSASTYPNIDLGSLSQTYSIKSLLTNSKDGVYPTGIYFTPTVPELSSQDIIVEISRSGKYRLYLEVEDEFGQFSSWCITNKQFSFNYPF